MSDAPQSGPWRYLLLQLPGWAVAALASGVLAWTDAIPAWAAGTLFGAFVVKDLVLYPLVRRAYEPSPPPGATLLGSDAVAREPLAPAGYVALQRQLWRAELLPGESHVPPGGTVVVRGIQGLTLLVVSKRHPSPPPRAGTPPGRAHVL